MMTLILIVAVIAGALWADSQLTMPFAPRIWAKVKDLWVSLKGE